MPIRKRLTGGAVDSSEIPTAVVSEEQAKSAGIVFDGIADLKPRARFRAALAAIPVGETMKVVDWNSKWVLPYLRQKFRVKGIELAIYPIDRRVLLDDQHTVCVTAQVSAINRHPKTGMPHVIRLDPDMHDTWYHLVVTWLVDSEFI